jgi:hypothetical protein
MMDVPVPSVKSHIKGYAETLADSVILTLKLDSREAAAQVHTKIHQGLKRVFGASMRGKGQDGAGIFKSIRNLANRAAKGLQPMAGQLFDQCASDPQSCIARGRSLAGQVRGAYESAQQGDFTQAVDMVNQGRQMIGRGSFRKTVNNIGRKIKNAASHCIDNPLDCIEKVGTAAALAAL